MDQPKLSFSAKKPFRRTLEVVPKVKELKEEHPKWTHQQIAEHLGSVISRSTVGRILSGEYDSFIEEPHQEQKKPLEQPTNWHIKCFNCQSEDFGMNAMHAKGDQVTVRCRCLNCGNEYYMSTAGWSKDKKRILKRERKERGL